MKILSVVGARPNFMKIAPFVHAIERHNQRLEIGDQNPRCSLHEGETKTQAPGTKNQEQRPD